MTGLVVLGTASAGWTWYGLSAGLLCFGIISLTAAALSTAFRERRSGS